MYLFLVGERVFIVEAYIIKHDGYEFTKKIEIERKIHYEEDEIQAFKTAFHLLKLIETPYHIPAKTMGIITYIHKL